MGGKHTKGTQKTQQRSAEHNDVHDVIPDFWDRGERTRLNPRQDGQPPTYLSIWVLFGP